MYCDVEKTVFVGAGAHCTSLYKQEMTLIVIEELSFGCARVSVVVGKKVSIVICTFYAASNSNRRKHIHIDVKLLIICLDPRSRLVLLLCKLGSSSIFLFSTTCCLLSIKNTCLALLHHPTVLH